MRPMRVLAFTLLLAPALTAAPASAQQPAGGRARARALPALADSAGVDRFAWLEDVEGARAMSWVKGQNALTVKALGADPRYATLYDRILTVLNSRERIPGPSIVGERIYNFWQDATHQRGLWRSTSWDSYVSGSPDWRTVLDVDSLAAAEKVAWAWRGATCLPPENRRCLVRLSRGGADAVQIRELDVGSGHFVQDGFFLPEAKQDVAWVDSGTVLVQSDFGPGTLTTSGYARMAKLWRRGSPLAQARTLVESRPTDVGVEVGDVRTRDGLLDIIVQRPSFFEANTYLVRGDSAVHLDLPLDADPDFVADQLVVYLRSPWTAGGSTFPAGALVAMPLERFLGGARDFRLLVAPGPRQAMQSERATRDYLLVSLLDNVRPRLLRFRPTAAGWQADTVPVPDFGSVDVSATSASTNRFFFTFAGFTQPTTLYLGAEDGSIREVRRLPAQFAADDLVTEQFDASSADGTRVPYFVVHRKGMKLDGTNPTLQYGYGGFEVSMTPDYNALVGAAWLARGGTYVLANIRGGGEFGPSWHRAAMRENRQRAYDDFIAVAQDLTRRHITSPAHLGIMGGSNGGLLMGNMLTQRPDLWNAVVIRNPLLDMKRYSHLLAGASWMAEYGDPDVPADWAFLQRYSPYQRLRAGVHYPMPFITTTTRDDRVHPGHARKFAAKLEALGDRVYFFENTEGGHGAGVTSAQRAREEALIYTYLWQRLGPAGALRTVSH